MDKVTKDELFALAHLVARIAGESKKHTPHGWESEAERDTYVATVLRFIRHTWSGENAYGLNIREVVDFADEFGRKAVEEQRAQV